MFLYSFLFQCLNAVMLYALGVGAGAPVAGPEVLEEADIQELQIIVRVMADL